MTVDIGELEQESYALRRISGVRGIDMRVNMSTPLLPQGVLTTDTDPVGLSGVGQA